ncbi:MAG: bifunctional 5,10-methylenetetrahydrofolate dehydrogenase/5,10-methenyltetrahydrofolate cyclohydrolase [Phascolarctobacterium sp.]|nr:bifunctional 5,10-methylenetetrahydrofolate dehydrogenase/5,10-methenyltetrahydrofolate cyclohydrolase [Phascolarctobacterium sp.]
MRTLVMRGKPVADAMRKKIEGKIKAAEKCGVKPALAIITAGKDPASHVYKDRLVKLTESLGASAKVIILPGNASLEQVLFEVRKLNRNRYVHGILPMMPMPRHIDGCAVAAAIAPNKDVDCLNPKNMGEVFSGESTWAPCTPLACMAILKYYGIKPEGKKAVVIGRSNVVGKPVAMLLLKENATVTICHSRTENLASVLKTADIIVAAVGSANFVKPDMVKKGAVIVDVGINVVDGGIAGDVDPAAAEKAAAFTPVPGGVGVVSNMMVMECLCRNL